MNRRSFLSLGLKTVFLATALYTGLSKTRILPNEPISFGEKLTIIIHDNAVHIPVIPFHINGQWPFVRQGVPVQVDRAHVELLLRTKETRYYSDGSFETCLCFPFTILHDPHPDGMHWFKSAALSS
jgi:hypothetical protein